MQVLPDSCGFDRVALGIGEMLPRPKLPTSVLGIRIVSWAVRLPRSGALVLKAAHLRLFFSSPSQCGKQQRQPDKPSNS